MLSEQQVIDKLGLDAASVNNSNVASKLLEAYMEQQHLLDLALAEIEQLKHDTSSIS